MASSQETKKVKKKSKNPYFVETYYVLKSDKKIKHGKYLKETPNGKLLVKGFYSNNKKDSTWEFFNYQSSLIKKGKYEKGSPIGIWEVYNGQSEPIYKYKVSNDSIIDYNWKNNNDRKTTIIENGITKEVLVDSPVLPKLDYSLADEVFRKVRYPADAKDNGISGTVWVAVIINKDGSSETPVIEESVYHSLDQEALRVIKNMDGKWIPAYYQGDAVKSKKIIPFSFELR